jgi:predicted secreted hydrolase
MFRPVNAAGGPCTAHTRCRCRQLTALIALVLCPIGAPAGDVEPYRRAAPGYRYSFPRDHFEHPAFRTEWWYYTGNLRDSAGKRYGFELVFFRQGQRRGLAYNPSAWRVDDLYLAHAAVTDISGKRFYYHERLNRAGPGVAGASLAQMRVWNSNWSAQWQGKRQTLQATTDEFRFRLDLGSAKPPVVHGLNGISRKGEADGEASHYVSLTRLNVSGELYVDGAKHNVTGVSWMDHEWFTNQLAKDQVGWDWLSVQLDNQTELMLFRLRRRDGSVDPYSAGTYIDVQGHARHLMRNEFSLTPQGYWKSARTGASYPVRWQIRVPSLGISLDAAAAVDAQELAAGDQTGPAYWEGSVNYTGSASGAGYLEMTGYDKPVRVE